MLLAGCWTYLIGFIWTGAAWGLGPDMNGVGNGVVPTLLEINWENGDAYTGAGFAAVVLPLSLFKVYWTAKSLALLSSELRDISFPLISSSLVTIGILYMESGSLLWACCCSAGGMGTTSSFC